MSTTRPGMRAFWDSLSVEGRWLLSTVVVQTLGRGLTLPFTIIYMHEVRGIAWTGRGRITAVEVSVDDGATWTAAILEGPVLPHAHVRFRFPWRFDGRAAVLASRAIDETGYVQPTVAQLLAARGRHSPSYHLNPIVGWAVDASGGITLRESPWR